MGEAWIYDSQGYYVLCPPYNVLGTDTPEVRVRFNAKPSSAQLKLYIVRIRVAEWFGLVAPHDVNSVDFEACWAVVNGTNREFSPFMPPLEKNREYSCSITDLVQAGENTFKLHFTPSGASIEYWVQLKIIYEGASIEEVVIPSAPLDFWSGLWQFVMNNGPMIMQTLIVIMVLILLLKIL